MSSLPAGMDSPDEAASGANGNCRHPRSMVICESCCESVIHERDKEWRADSARKDETIEKQRATIKMLDKNLRDFETCFAPFDLLSYLKHESDAMQAAAQVQTLRAGIGGGTRWERVRARWNAKHLGTVGFFRARWPVIPSRSYTLPEPIPMLLTCPCCGERHIDEGEFITKWHHTHACQSCGMVWRPAVVPTVGVRFLPGFKNEATLGV